MLDANRGAGVNRWKRTFTHAPIDAYPNIAPVVELVGQCGIEQKVVQLGSEAMARFRGTMWASDGPAVARRTRPRVFELA